MCRCSAHTTTRDVCCGVRLGSTLSPYPPTQSTTFVGFRVFSEAIKICGRYISLILKGAASEVEVCDRVWRGPCCCRMWPHWAQFFERNAGQGRAGHGRAGRAGQGRQGKAGQGRAGQARAGHRAGGPDTPQDTPRDRSQGGARDSHGGPGLPNLKGHRLPRLEV